MRKTVLFFLTFALFGIMFSSCTKKGENDPFISLHSRKARLAGDWKLSKYELTDSYKDNSGTDTYVYSYDGTTMTETYNGTPSKYAYSWEMFIDKKGDFKRTITTSQSGSAQAQTDEGQWYFAGRNKAQELKNKEAVVFCVLKTTTSSSSASWTGVYADWIYVIDELKNKELIFKIDQTGTYSDGSSYNTTGTLTFTQK